MENKIPACITSRLTLNLCLVVLLMLSSCKKEQDEKEMIPACVEDLINAISDEPCNDGYTVEKYRFQGKIVYMFIPAMCPYSGQARVLDSDCNYLGGLGSAYGSTINGVEFMENAVFIKIIWKRN